MSLSNSRKTDPTTWLPRNPAKFRLSGHRLPITSVAFHPIYMVLASASEDCSIKIWDWELGELERTLKGHTKAVLDVDFSPSVAGSGADGILLASCSSDLTIKIWDPSKDYSNVRTLTGHDHTVSTIRFTPMGTHLISGSRDKTIRIWDVQTGYSVKTLQVHNDWVRTIQISNDGETILSAGQDRTARITAWRDSDTKSVMVGHEHVIECTIFAPASAETYLAQMEGLSKAQGSYVVTGGRDKLIKIWNCRGECIATLKGHENWVRGLTFQPAGKYLISVSDDRSIRCWDMTQRGRCVKVVADAHSHFVQCVRWAPGIEDSGTASNGSAPASIGSTQQQQLAKRSRLSMSGKPGSIGMKSARSPENYRNMRCVIATGSVDADIKIWM